MKDNREKIIVDLRNSLSWMDLVIATLNEGVIVVGEDMKIIFVNDATASMLGQYRINYYGQFIWDILKLKQGNKNIGEKHYKDAINTNTLNSLDGIYTLNNLTVNISLGYIENVKQIVIVIRDDSKLSLYVKLLMESTNEGIYGIDSKGKCTFINNAAAKILGYSQDELYDKVIHKIIHYKNIDNSPLFLNQCPIFKTVKTGKEFKIEEDVFWRKDGSSFYVSYSSSPIIQKNKIIGSVIVFTDVSRSKYIKDSEKFLSEATAIINKSLNYQKTLKRISNIIVPKLADFCYIDMIENDNKISRVTWQHINIKKDNTLKEVFNYIPSSSHETYLYRKEIIKGKTVFLPNIEIEWIEKFALSKEHLKYLSVLKFNSLISVPLKVRNKTIGVLTVVYDKNSMRHYSEFDLILIEELTRRASYAIENSELFSETQKAVSLRNNFLAIASHELKTPVTSVKMYTQILERRFTKNGDLDSADLLQKMDRQLNKLTNLISTLLDVTKIEADKLVFEIVEEMQRISDKSKLNIINNKNDILYIGDRERIGQVISNLISNAIKYSEKDKDIDIVIVEERQDIKLTVKDLGPGIPLDKQEHIFERFYRVNGPGQETYPGLGLGLYISSEIIKRHGGKIWVESIEGKGSTFCFNLPYIK